MVIIYIYISYIMFNNDNETDNYMTPPYVWDLIIPFIPKEKIIWEAFFGDGESGEYLKSKGFNVIHQDIDFFENDSGEIIVSNIPFSKKQEVFTRLKLLNKPFIVISSAVILSNVWFQKLFKNEIGIIIPNHRLKYRHLTINKDKLYTAPPTWFFCYKNDKIGNNIFFL